jgi:hypothetical protein
MLSPREKHAAAKRPQLQILAAKGGEYRVKTSPPPGGEGKNP